MDDMVVLILPNKKNLWKLRFLGMKNNIGNQEEFLCAFAEAIWPGHFYWGIWIVPGQFGSDSAQAAACMKYLEYSELPSWKSLPGSSL